MKNMKIDPENLKLAMRNWTTGVCILCVQHECYHHGMTVNSFSSVSLDPPLITVTLQNDSHTRRLVNGSGFFSISILNSSQQIIAEIFSQKVRAEKDRFKDIKTVELPEGMKAIQDALSILVCKVYNPVVFQNSTLYISEVMRILDGPNEKPLVYHNREYKNL